MLEEAHYNRRITLNNMLDNNDVVNPVDKDYISIS